MRLSLPVVAVFLATIPGASRVAAQQADDGSQSVTVAAVAPAGGLQIITFDLSGRQVAKLLEEHNDLNFPGWSDDNRQLVFMSARSGLHQIHRIDADGTNQVALTQTGSNEDHPRWRPDGKKIALASSRTGNYEIFVIDADGSNPVNLTNSPSYDSDPSWSPDGTQIAFASNRDGRFGAFNIWVMDADGKNARRLVARDTTGFVYPSWSPDGAQILFSDRVDDGSWQIFVATIDGRSVEQLTEGAGGNSFANWSPDGRYIAYMHFDKPMNQSPGPGRLMLYDTETATHRKLGPDDVKCNGSWPAWRQDGAQRKPAQSTG
jgi:Tol biopolymer transport system component